MSFAVWVQAITAALQQLHAIDYALEVQVDYFLRQVVLQQRHGFRKGLFHHQFQGTILLMIFAFQGIFIQLPETDRTVAPENRPEHPPKAHESSSSPIASFRTVRSYS